MNKVDIQGKIGTVEKTWLSKDEAKAYLGCGDKFLKTLRDGAKVRFSQYGKMIWYELDSINRFLNKNKAF